jgi:CheY-like chemotaxis protein
MRGAGRRRSSLNGGKPGPMMNTWRHASRPTTTERAVARGVPASRVFGTLRPEMRRLQQQSDSATNRLQRLILEITVPRGAYAHLLLASERRATHHSPSSGPSWGHAGPWYLWPPSRVTSSAVYIRSASHRCGGGCRDQVVPPHPGNAASFPPLSHPPPSSRAIRPHSTSAGCGSRRAIGGVLLYQRLREHTIWRYSPSAGYEVTVVESAFGAATLVRDLQPVAVLLDIGLPFRPGTELLDESKSDARTASVPVVVTSGLTESLSAERRALAAAVLPKPFGMDDLLAVLRRVSEDESQLDGHG